MLGSNLLLQENDHYLRNVDYVAFLTLLLIKESEHRNINFNKSLRIKCTTINRDNQNIGNYLFHV